MAEIGRGAGVVARVSFVFIRWLGISVLLNLAWEIAQLPLYAIYVEGDLRTIAFAVAHCTAGDAVIAALTFVVAAAVARSWRWPVERPWPGLAAAIPAGMAYTAFSEWLNVSVRGAWAYAAAMPQVVGIGVAPLLQWLFVPGLALLLLRVGDRPGRRLSTSSRNERRQ